MSDPSSETGAGVYDVVIVGAGPAGLTAAIYASRGRLKTAVLERNMAGGQIALTDLVENYPGFPEGISGFDLSQKMKEQAEKFGAEMREIEGVAELRTGRRKAATSSSPTARRSTRASVILAPGVEPRRSGIPGEAEFIGRGVSWCATCDGALYRGKTVAVIGGGDSAVEEGMFLTKFADKVYLVHRRDELRAAPIAQERALRQLQVRVRLGLRPQADRRRRDGRGPRGRERQDRRGALAPGQRRVHVHRPDPQHRMAQGHSRAGRVRLHRHRRLAAHRASGRVRLRRRPRQPAEADRHGGRRRGARGRAGRALPRRSRERAGDQGAAAAGEDATAAAGKGAAGTQR